MSELKGSRRGKTGWGCKLTNIVPYFNYTVKVRGLKSWCFAKKGCEDFRRVWKVFGGYGSLEHFAKSWTNLDNQQLSVNASISVMGRVSGWTLSNSYSLKTPPTSTIGNFTLYTRSQSSKMSTAYLFLYLVDFGTALSTQSSSSSIVFGKRNLPSAMAKTICKSLQVHNAFGIQICCNAKLFDNYKQKLTNTMHPDWIKQITHTRHCKEKWEKYIQHSGAPNDNFWKYLFGRRFEI